MASLKRKEIIAYQTLKERLVSVVEALVAVPSDANIDIERFRLDDETQTVTFKYVFYKPGELFEEGT